MPPPSDPKPAADRPAKPARQHPRPAAQFLRSAVGFGAVTFHERPGCARVSPDTPEGHADCLPCWTWLGEWSWRDPDRSATAGQLESER